MLPKYLKVRNDQKPLRVSAVEYLALEELGQENDRNVADLLRHCLERWAPYKRKVKDLEHRVRTSDPWTMRMLKLVLGKPKGWLADLKKSIAREVPRVAG